MLVENKHIDITRKGEEGKNSGLYKKIKMILNDWKTDFKNT